MTNAPVAADAVIRVTDLKKAYGEVRAVDGVTFGTWTDWRNTVAGTDLRETEQDETGADVLQCRHVTTSGAISGDTCPRDGGLDQNIYGDYAP